MASCHSELKRLLCGSHGANAALALSVPPSGRTLPWPSPRAPSWPSSGPLSPTWCSLRRLVSSVSRAGLAGPPPHPETCGPAGCGRWEQAVGASTSPPGRALRGPDLAPAPTAGTVLQRGQQGRGGGMSRAVGHGRGLRETAERRQPRCSPARALRERPVPRQAPAWSGTLRAA